MPRHLILATAGHVDHGKTALIKALTGTDTDRLPEEKARGITIELGFAQLELGDLSLGVIDVPGHEDFIRNMIAGIGAVDVALFVIAADDGWMRQTEEHLQILEYLGVRHAVVAMTKCDLAPPPENEVRAKLAGSIFADAPLVNVSTRSETGIEELKSMLSQVCAGLPPPTNIGKPRLFVDRAFTLHGIGLVATGTLTGGVLQRGDEIVTYPSGGKGRIRAIETHNRAVEKASPGMRTALNLPGVEAGRGDVVTRAEYAAAHDAIDVLVERSARLPPETRPLRHGATLRVHHGSGSSFARIFFLREEKLAVRQSAIARLRFAAPIAAFVGERFVLRDPGGARTLGGATVLDLAGKEFRDRAQQRLLVARAAAPKSAQVFLHTQLTRDYFARRSEVLQCSRFSAEEIDGAKEWLTDPNWWRATRERAVSLIDHVHATEPQRSGLELTKLREDIALPPEIFEELVRELEAKEFRRAGELIARRSHQPALPEHLRAAGERIRAMLAAKPFDPPSRKDLALDSKAQQALRFLLETNEAVEISPDLVLGHDALEQMRAQIIVRLQSGNGCTVSELRQALGSSRRVMVPLLQYFDRTGLTRRVGDQRFLVSAR